MTCVFTILFLVAGAPATPDQGLQVADAVVATAVELPAETGPSGAWLPVKLVPRLWSPACGGDLWQCLKCCTDQFAACMAQCLDDPACFQACRQESTECRRNCQPNSS